MNTPKLSICIPSYNRPQQLSVLLRSVDCDAAVVEIVICEDCSPKQEEVRAVVREFVKESPYCVSYHENELNYGYDANLRKLIDFAKGQFVLFMGVCFCHVLLLVVYGFNRFSCRAFYAVHRFWVCF